MDLEFFKQNRDKFVETDPDLKLDARLFSITALNPFINYNSSPRGLMMSSSHLPQMLVIEDGETPYILTGLEHELSKTAISVEAPTDMEIIDVVRKYDTVNVKANVVDTIIYRDMKTGEISFIDAPVYHKYHSYFGFKYNRTKHYKQVKPGGVLREGSPLELPPTVTEVGDYKFGKEIRTAFMTLPGVDEDGFIISETLAKSFKFRVYETREIEVGQSSYLLNLYGDENNYKPFPEIGEYINETGIIAASRKFNNEKGPGLYSRRSSRIVDPIFDNCVYTRGPGGKVIDIKVLYNPKTKNRLPEELDRYIRKYADALISYYTRIINIFESIVKEYKKLNRRPPISHKFHMLVTEAYGIVESSDPKNKIKKSFKRKAIDTYRIEFVIEYELTAGRAEFNTEDEVTAGGGKKLTGLSGDKGTIVQIWKDEDMPVDKEGNRADLIMDPKATVSRLNIARLYERYIKAALVKVKRYVVNDIKKKGGWNKLTDGDIREIYHNHILPFTNMLENKFSAYYKEISENDVVELMRDILKETYEDMFRIYLTLDNGKKAYEIVIDIINSKYAPPYDKVKFRYDNLDKESKDSVLIAPMTIIILNKIADSPLATSSAKVNHFKIPISVGKEDKYRLPYRNTPVRALGETESRVFVAYGGREMTAELRDRAVSMSTHEMVYMNILKSNKPTDVEELVDRSIQSYGKDVPSQILKTVWNTVGVDLKYVDDKELLRPYTGEVENIDVSVDEIKEIKEEEGRETMVENKEVEEETGNIFMKGGN